MIETFYHLWPNLESCNRCKKSKRIQDKIVILLAYLVLVNSEMRSNDVLPVCRPVNIIFIASRSHIPAKRRVDVHLATSLQLPTS